MSADRNKYAPPKLPTFANAAERDEYITRLRWEIRRAEEAKHELRYLSAQRWAEGGDE